MKAGSGVVVGGAENRDLVRTYEFFENAESHEGYDILAIGWVFPNVDTFFTGGSNWVDCRLRKCGLFRCLSYETQFDGINFFTALLKMMIQIIHVIKLLRALLPRNHCRIPSFRASRAA